jgi:hypothetical protein
VLARALRLEIAFHDRAIIPELKQVIKKPRALSSFTTTSALSPSVCKLCGIMSKLTL